MLRALASAFFYTRFLHRFSRIGERQRQASFAPFNADMQGKTWLVSGASGGIGAAIAETANRHGAHVLLAARSPDRIQAIVARATDPARMQALPIDFASIASVRAALAKLKKDNRRIDVLVNNVGVLLNQHTLNAEGLESSFVSNLLSHFELTEGLHTAGLLSPDGAVVNMTSGGMYGMPLKLEPMLAGDPSAYDGMAVYAMHKRAQMVLTEWWNQQWQGSPRVYAMHPGWVDTDGVKSSLPWFRAILRSVLRSPQGAADTALWLAATRPDTAPGVWLDRVLDPEHVFDLSRKSPHSGKDLAEFLRKQSARIRSA